MSSSSPPTTKGNVIYPAWAAETYSEKAIRKCRENPFVPLGMLLTTGALIGSARQLLHRNSRGAQIYWRWRIGFQGLTILAFCIGSYEIGYGEAIHGPRNVPPAPKGPFDAQPVHHGKFSLFPGLTEKAHEDTIAASREKGNRERAAFEERLKEAEDAWAAEQEALGEGVKKRGVSAGEMRLRERAQSLGGAAQTKSAPSSPPPTASETQAASRWTAWIPWHSSPSAKPKPEDDK